MIRLGKYHFLIILWMIFLVHQLFIRLELSNVFLQSYLDDVLALPVMLGTYLALMQIKKPSFTIPITWIIVAIIVVFIHFELLLPELSETYTCDWMDGLMYGIGGLFFSVWMNKKKTGWNSPSHRFKLNI